MPSMIKSRGEFQLLTIGFVKSLCADIGISVNRNQCGELRVNRVHSSEATAYYTNDLSDALDTARHMHHEN